MLEHARYRYEECYAKVILEHFGIYMDLVIQDRPDLYDLKNDIGVEVTEAIEQSKKEATKLWYTMKKHPLPKRIRNMERMQQLGYEYQGGIQLWGGKDYTNGINSSVYNIIYDSIRTKEEKLNSGNYKMCKQNNLFLLTEIMIKDEWEYKLLLKVKEIISDFKLKFNNVYILFQNDLVELQIDNEYIRSFEINEFQSVLANNAWYYAQGGE